MSETSFASPSVLALSALTAVREQDRVGLKLALSSFPDEEYDRYFWLFETLFAQGAVNLLGEDATKDQLYLVAQALNSAAGPLVAVHPYLFEKLLRRHYGEPDIVDGISQAEALLAYTVGAAALTAEDPEAAVDAAMAFLGEDAPLTHWTGRSIPPGCLPATYGSRK